MCIHTSIVFFEGAALVVEQDAKTRCSPVRTS